MSKVLVNGLNVRAGPSTSSAKVAHYDAGDIINSGDLLMENEGRIWLRYTGASGNHRYVCARNNDGALYVQPASHIAWPVPIPVPIPVPDPVPVPNLPRQTEFPDNRIKRWGCCFLCTCVKGGLTNFNQCMDCFNWGMNSGKLRSSDCYVSCNKEAWAREISQRFGTPYHGDYVFQKNSHHFWLVQNGVEIFNSMGIGWRG